MHRLRLPSLTLTSALLTLLVACLLCECVLGARLKGQRSGQSRRYPRARYRVGYLFGKRSGAEMGTEHALSFLDLLSRNALTTKELQKMLEKQPETVSEVIRILDKNNDGYITLSDVM